MAYSSLAEVKSLLRETTTDYDTEISNAIDDFDVKIDTKLKKHESALPLSPAPDAIKKASKYGAAGLWLRLNPVSETHKEQSQIFLEIANEFINLYIKETYYVGKVIQ